MLMRSQNEWLRCSLCNAALSTQAENRARPWHLHTTHGLLGTAMGQRDLECLDCWLLRSQSADVTGLSTLRGSSFICTFLRFLPQPACN